MTEAGERILQAAREALTIARGEADPSTFRVHHAAALVRRATSLSQEAFASRYHLPLDHLRAWERGEAEPDDAMRAYLRVIMRDPDFVARTLADAPAKALDAAE